MADWPFGESGVLDGMVGVVLESEQPTSYPWPDDSHIHVGASGDELSGSWAIGLEDDVRLLVEAFLAGGASRWREMTEGLLARPSGESVSRERDGDIEVAVHGLPLDSEGEEELRELIRMLVRERMTRSERDQ